MSSGSESDDDYVPEEPEKVSEEESAEEETELQYEEEVDQKNKKRKSRPPGKGKKRIKTQNGEIIKKSDEDKSEEQVTQNPEEDKKREDDLWAKFLEGTDTKPKPSAATESNKTEATQPSAAIKKNSAEATNKIKNKDDDKERERRIFEFAGETIVVENNVIKEKIKTPDSAATVSKLEGTSRSRGGGLSNVLGQLNKKNQLSTLEKSKLDWVTYKKEEGIEEEIVHHNKGKAGFLDRRDFLERTDVRQYEIERDLRMSKRSNR